MKSDVYHLVTVDDGKSDVAAIIKVFSEMASGRLACDLKLLNYYNEVPVSFGTTIITVENDRVELVIHEHHALIIKHDKSTLITSKHFHNGVVGVHCHAAHVNETKKTAILYNFAYALIRAQRREVVRVKVQGTLPVRFICKNITIEGDMADISGNGLAFHSDLVPQTESGQTGVLYFTLNGISLEAPGSFIRSVTDATGGHLCMFKMDTDNKISGIVSRFIFQRQVEIIQQLKEGRVSE